MKILVVKFVYYIDLSIFYKCYHSCNIRILSKCRITLIQGFKGKKFKSDPQDGTPYCYDCFEKLLGHYGDAHEIHGI